MKVWRITSFGIDHLELKRYAAARASTWRGIGKVHAVSLNYRDLLTVKGLYSPKMALPRIPCSDGAGEVVEVGDQVTSIRRGQRVAGIFMQNWLEGRLTAGTRTGSPGRRRRRRARRIRRAQRKRRRPHSREALLSGGGDAALRRCHRMERGGPCGTNKSRRCSCDPRHRGSLHFCIAIREDAWSESTRHFKQRGKAQESPRVGFACGNQL